MITTKLAPPLRVDCPRDRFKRPTLVDPTTGKESTWQRVTTLAGMLDDTYNLSLWQQRMVAKGIAWRDDLRIAAATTDDSDRDGKAALDEICERAKDAAGANQGSALGTAFHRVTQIADAYPDVPAEQYCPPELRRELMAYMQLVTAHGLAMPVEYQERTGVCVQTATAGTWDNLAHGGPCACGLLHVADKKSGQHEFEYGQGKIAAQLAMYSRFSALWLAVGGGYEDVPAICQRTAYVLYVPIGRADEACLYPVDLEQGWERALLAVAVRQARSVKRGLFGEAMTLPGAVPVHDTVTPRGDPITIGAKPKRTRRTKAQIEADNEAAAHPGATKCAHHVWSDDEIVCDQCPLDAGITVDDATAAKIIASQGEAAGNSLTRARLDAIEGDQARRAGTGGCAVCGTTHATIAEAQACGKDATGETGTAFLLNGELKPGPAEALDLNDPADAAIHESETRHGEAAAIELLQDKLGAEVVPATVERVCPHGFASTMGCDECSGRNRQAAYAALRNGTNAHDERNKLNAPVRDERKAMLAAIDEAGSVDDIQKVYGLWSTYWSPQVDEYAIMRLISITGTREGLDRIWETYQSVWTDDLTAAGMARLAELARA